MIYWITALVIMAALLWWGVHAANETARYNEKITHDDAIARIERLHQIKQAHLARVKELREQHEIYQLSGVILDLQADKRMHLLSRARESKDDSEIKIRGMKRDVKNWCKDFCTGRIEPIPYLDGPNWSRGQLWFENEDDAFSFRMRWY